MSALQLVLIQIVTFAIFIWVLKFVFYNDLAKAKNRLAQLNKENMEKEKELKSKIDAAQRESKKIVQQATAEAQKVKEEANQAAEKIVNLTKENAEREKEMLTARANESFERLKADLTSKMNRKSLQSACDIVAHLFKERFKEDIHTQMVEDLIRDIEALDKNLVSIQTEIGKVATPLKISFDQKKKLQDAILDKTGKSISLEEEIDEALMAGIKLNFGGLVLDGSLKNRLELIQRKNSG